MNMLYNNYNITGFEMLFFLLMMVVILVIANKRSKRIKYLEKVQIKTIDDNIAFKRELQEKFEYSDEQIQSLRDKTQPENDME